LRTNLKTFLSEVIGQKLTVDNLIATVKADWKWKEDFEAELRIYLSMAEAELASITKEGTYEPKVGDFGYISSHHVSERITIIKLILGETE